VSKASLPVDQRPSRPSASKTHQNSPAADPFAQRLEQTRVRLITLEEWYRTMDFKAQRNTELHAVKAKKSYLNGDWKPTWDTVSAAQLPDGSLCKLDGHTRAYLWERGELALPPTGKIVCHVYPVADLAAAKALYDTFDSEKAAKHKADFIYGELRATGMLDRLQTSFLRSGSISEALRLSTGLDRIEASVSMAMEALLLLDGIGPKKAYFRSGILGAALLTLRAHGQRAIDTFWGPYNSREYFRQGNRCNGPGALEERAREIRLAKLYGRDAEIALNRYALDLYVQTQRKKTILVPRTTDLAVLLHGMLQLPSARDRAKAWGLSWGSEEAE